VDKETRTAIEKATQRARKLLEADFAEQLEGTYDVLPSGQIAPMGGSHLNARQRLLREKIVSAVEHKRAAGMKPVEAVADYLRDTAFTALNRFVALKMLEARDLVQECISKGDQSSGYREFCGLAPGVALLPNGAGYRLYLECIFDELSTEVKVLFDRRDVASVLWPRRPALERVLEVLNGSELARVWREDETIGWVYQFFNSHEERRAMREASQAPRNGRELAARNQFFTPRYVVQFLTDNTLGRIWYELRQGETRLVEICKYMMRRPDENYNPRPKKDPRDLRILDPACGSGHFLLYAFDLLLLIYEEAWLDPDSPRSEETGRTLQEDYPSRDFLYRELPGLILRHNLHGVDIDPRCSQITQLALWMRAQRAFRDFAVARSKRPLIRRSNIVIAESMADDVNQVEEISTRIDAPGLRDLLQNLIVTLRTAGELGLLLRLERALQPLQKAQLALFSLPAEHLRELFLQYTITSNTALGSRRRLFAEDALQGIGFLHLIELRYTVLLVNPPFGDTTPGSAAYIEREYYNTRLDLFASFCERLLELSEPNGLIGAITPRDGFFKKTLVGWRELVLRHHMPVVADLGLGVLDSATVRVAAYVIAKTQSDESCRFFDLVDLSNRGLRLRREIQDPRRVYDVRLSSFRNLPLVRFLYWLPPRLWEIYVSAEPLENRSCTPRYGLTTLSDERFCRLSFEVDPATIGADRGWVFLSKGGDDYPYGGVSNCLVRWKDGAAEMAEVNRQANGQIAQTRRASKYYFRPAVTFSNRSVQFSVRWHPANFAFSVRGPAVVPLRASQAYLLGFFNSRLVRALIQMQTASQTYTSGVLKELRWIEPDDGTREAVELAATEAFIQVRLRLATVETDPFFEGLWARAASGPPKTVPGYLEWRRHFVEELNAGLQVLQETLDRAVSELYGVSITEIERCERVDEEDGKADRFPPQFRFPVSSAEALASYLFGVAIGRWIPRVVERAPALEAAAPEVQPSALGAADVLPIVVDDPGHVHAIVAMMRTALRQVFRDSTEADGIALERALGIGLREWLARKFFPMHIASYSGFGRSAPIYWQLATPSASYSVWLYIHAFNRDTLYKVQEIAAAKLLHEEGKLESLRSDCGPNPTAAERKALAVQENFVEELRTFLEEVKRVAPLWNPDLDDGVIINFSPLWRLVPHHKPWQKELKETWKKLCAGEYDWAHLAMHIWPERVVPKCAPDRSLAIAHGLEDVFWEESPDGRWKPRSAPTRPMEELVRERASSAVKMAVKSLLEAPLAMANGRRGRSRGRRKQTGEAV
jgi:Eco57I restriction-modification methylase